MMNVVLEIRFSKTEYNREPRAHQNGVGNLRGAMSWTRQSSVAHYARFYVQRFAASRGQTPAYAKAAGVSPYASFHVLHVVEEGPRNSLRGADARLSELVYSPAIDKKR
jgi:hypothetical protein